MEELIKGSMLSYAVVAAFSGFVILRIIFVLFKNTKDIKSKMKKTVLRFGISGVLVCFWAWFFVYINLYPISLAYYEYNHDCVEEKIGVINTIEQDGKDRIVLIIDDTEYTMVDSSVSPAVIIGIDVDKGDTVIIKFGVRSRYIFDIHKSKTSP